MTGVSNVVHNLSSKRIPALAQLALALGAKFVPDNARGYCTPQQRTRAFTRYLWLLRCRMKYGRSGSGCPRFRHIVGAPEKRSSFLNETRYFTIRRAVERVERILISRLQYLRLCKSELRNNFPSQLRAAVRSLAADDSILVKQADKGLGLVVIDAKQYHQLNLAHLQSARDFRPLSALEVAEHVADVRHQLQELIRFSADCLPTILPQTAGQYTDYLKGWNHCQLPVFYGLIKVHKTAVCIRPIVTCQKWITTAVSQLCAHELNAVMIWLHRICMCENVLILPLQANC